MPDEIFYVEKVVGRKLSDEDGPEGELSYMWLVKWYGYVRHTSRQACANLITNLNLRYAWDRCSWIPTEQMDNSAVLIKSFFATLVAETEGKLQSVDVLLLEEAVNNGWKGVNTACNREDS